MDVRESLIVKEQYFDTNRGFIIKPTEVQDRPTDITGYILGTSTKNGELSFITNKIPLIPDKTSDVTLSSGDTSVTSNGQSGKILIDVGNISSFSPLTFTVINSYAASGIVIPQIFKLVNSDKRFVANILQVNSGSFDVLITNVGSDSNGEIFGFSYCIF